MQIERQTISTLQQFYALMAATREVRLAIVTQYLKNGSFDSGQVDSLQYAADSLKAIPQSESGASVKLDENRSISIDLSYEISELDKDILFLTSGEKAFEEYLDHLHPTYAKQIRKGLQLLEKVDVRNFITDRDGTVNNYCGRYLSSIQSVYNSVYLARYARVKATNTVVLTSAPLENGGLVDITTIPTGIVVNAGSKGREYRDLSFERHTFAVDLDQQKKLDELNARLQQLIREPQYEKFGLIGSALQLKFGQTTIARQDVTKSVPEDESNAFLSLLEKLVGELDPEGHFFRIEDTGLDVEIILTVPSDADGGERKDFSKGNGVGFLNDELNLDLATGPNLVCGDTGSDVPMLEECLNHSQNTWSIFVTKNEDLKKRVKSLTDQSLIVDEPDTLVSILKRLASQN